MASAAITLAENPATIESDTNEAVITNSGLQGVLVNASSTTAFIKVSVTGTTASSVPTTNAQAQYVVPLPSGASMPVLANYNTLAHKTASGSTVLGWFPGFTRFP